MSLSREREPAVAAWNERFRAAFQHAPVGIGLVSLEGHLLEVNEALCRLLRYTERELLTVEISSLSVEGGSSVDVGALEPTRMERQLRRGDGEAVWVAISTSLVRDRDEHPLYVVISADDIGERKRAERELRILADQDALTGLLNRRGFLEGMRRELYRMRRRSDRGALLLLDLDHFKLVNDTAGHAEGDRLLRATADVLKRRLRATDVIGRLGGDEFAALVLNVDEEQARELAEGLGELVQCRVDAEDGLVLDVKASVGVVVIDEEVAGDEEALLAAADHAMYDTKLQSRIG
jgi:diguanylate cyclase (GGDEF)-like protein/PAS domain S-box-containing protein